MKSNLISILFSLRKGNAHPSLLTNDLLESVGLNANASLEEVMSHYRLVIQYIPELGEHADSDIMDTKIIKLEILYNGFTPFQNPMGCNPDGMFETGDTYQRFDGRIMPILRFRFDREVEEESALRALEATCFQFITPRMAEAGEVYELSDHNGWNEVIDEDSECNVMTELNEQGVVRYDEDDDVWHYPVYTFDNGLDTHGQIVEWPLWYAKQD